MRMRDIIRAELAAIVPLDVLEAEHLADALAWVDSGAELFRVAKPATPPKHLVSYFAVVDGEQVLLVDHRNARLWLPSGGHVEPDEHPRSTVLRELQEELGFAPNQPIEAPLMVSCTPTVGLTAGHVDVSLWYVVRAQRGQPIRFDETEFVSVKWFRFSELPVERSEPHLRRFVRKLLSSPGGTSAAQNLQVHTEPSGAVAAG
jgi:8-oxo-dGTP pyrophosphatase MutT (NUDIX family)